MTITHTNYDVRKVGGRIGEANVRYLNAAGRTRFASHFGDLTTAHPTVPSLTSNEHILPVVVRVHPESGERGLFIGGFTQKILGLSGTESRAIVRLLQAYVTRPENSVRWAPGDLLLFDNRITQHYAADDYGDLPRRLHRATVACDVPVGVDGRRSYVVEGDQAEHYTPKAA